MKNNLLSENMRRFGTKNINEVETYVAGTSGPFNSLEIKIYEHILDALELCIPGTPGDVIDDFTDNNEKGFYTAEFKKIIESVQRLAKMIDKDMSDQAG